MKTASRVRLKRQKRVILAAGNTPATKQSIPAAAKPRERDRSPCAAQHVKQRVAAASICSYCDGCRVVTAAFCELDWARQRYTTRPWAVACRYFNLLNTNKPFTPTCYWCYRCQADHPCYNPRTYITPCTMMATA